MEIKNEVEILFVEDNPCDAEIALRALNKHKLINHIVHVKDGQEALEWLFGTGQYAGRDLTHRPKVVLLDLKLPKVNGLEVLQAMRENSNTRLIPVVILTSSREEGDVVKSYKLGVNSYIVKPVEFENFSTAVAEAGHYWMLVNQEPK